MTVGIYIRVSTEEQAKEGYSIPAQKERLIAYCNAMGWTDYKLYIDEGVSAKDLNRPKLQLLLNDVRNHRITTLLVYRLDRFTRKVKDLHKLLEILESNGCAFKSATEPYDTSTAMGKLFITIVAALAEWETDNLSERIKMALEEKVASGERVGNIPFGFDLDTNEKLIKNGDGPFVIDMIEKYETGWSLNRIANYLNLVTSSRTWRANTVKRILQNPALYGATKWVDNIFEGTHEGYISKTRWLRLQKMMEDRGVHFRKDVKSIYLFQGILRCKVCGSMHSVNRYLRKRKDGTEYETISYKCRNCYINQRKAYQPTETKLEKAFIEYMSNIKFENLELPKEEKDESKEIKQKLLKLEKQREKYQRAWAADLITDDEFEKRMYETRTLQKELQEKLKNKNGPELVDPEALKKMIFTFKKVYSHLTKEERRAFIQKFVQRIDFDIIEQPPTRPDKYKKGMPKIIITNIDFY